MITGVVLISYSLCILSNTFLTFVNVVLKHGKAVDIVERCNNGIKELKCKPSSGDINIIWTKLETNATYSRQNPTVLDLYEKRLSLQNTGFLRRGFFHLET